MTLTPNQNQILSFIRQLLTFFGGVAVARGWITADNLPEIVGAIITIGSVAWSFFSHTKAATVAKAADIVTISAAAQQSVGITAPQLTPTSPKI